MAESERKFQQSQQYYELTEILRMRYGGHPMIPVGATLMEIDAWINTPACKPLLITSHPGGGIKTLLCAYLKHKEQTQDDIVLYQFTSANPSYSTILYKLMAKLRNLLNINQQVELNEERVRRYFPYWLETASSVIERRYIGYEEAEKKKVVIVIEGADRVVDGKGCGVVPTFWLPQILPKNVRLILTAAPDSIGCKILLPLASCHMPYHLPEQQLESLISGFHESLKIPPNSTFTLNQLRVMEKIIEGSQLFFVPENVTNFQMFLLSYIEFVAGEKISTEVILKLLGALACSWKGLTKEALRKFVKISMMNITTFFMHFHYLTIKLNNFYLIEHREVIKCIIAIIEKNTLNLHFNRKTLHHMLAKSLKKQTMSIHYLEERIFHLLYMKNYTELKEILSQVEHFLILYTPLSKHLLCVCWFKLELQFQYDPVFEYNKAIQRFLNNYYPSPDEMFKIIFQLALFFKEYSEFQSHKTPKFRHPPLRGECEQLKQICLWDELVKMNMYQRPKDKNKRKNSNKKNGKKDDKKCEKKEKSGQSCSIEKEQNEPHESQIDVETLNVKIQFHQQKFRNYYEEQMHPFIKEYCRFKKKYKAKKEVLDEDSDCSDSGFDERKNNFIRIKNEILLKNYKEFHEEEYHRCGDQKSFYYYKQWIWLQFPWISQSIHHDFSSEISHCLKSPTEYMSIKQEYALIQDALKIAKIARNNKKQIYQEKQIHLTPLTSSYIFKKTGSLTELSKFRNNNSKSRGSLEKNKPCKDHSMPLYRLNSPNKKDLVQWKKVDKIDPRGHSHTFLTNLSLNQSEFESSKQNTSRAKKLPQIPKCSPKLDQSKKWISKGRKNYKRSEEFILAKYNQIKGQNSSYLRRIQNLKQTKQVTDISKLNSRATEDDSQIAKLKRQSDRVDKLYTSQQLLKEKLETIIKLCDINKSHGSESSDLNYFLSSLKFMTKIEKERIQSLHMKGKAFMDEYKKIFKKLREQRENQFHKIHNQSRKSANKNSKMINHKLKDTVPQKYEKVRIFSGTSKKNDKDKHALKKKKFTFEKDEIKRKKELKEKERQKVKAMEVKLCEQFGIIFGFDKENDQVLKQYEYQMEKNKKLKWKLNQLQVYSQKKNKQITILQKKEATLKMKNDKKYDEHFRSQYEKLISEKKQKQERKILLEKCLKLLRT